MPIPIDKDCFAIPADATPIAVSSSLLSSATEVLLYYGAIWSNIHRWTFDQFITSTDIASGIDILQFAIYQSTDNPGAMPTATSLFSLVASWDHNVTLPATTGVHVTTLGSPVVVEGGYFIQVHGKSPNATTGTDYRLNSMGANELGIVTNGPAIAAVGFTPAHFQTDIVITDPAPTNPSGNIIGGDDTQDFCTPVCRWRLVS